jgi:hypothetical protein
MLLLLNDARLCDGLLPDGAADRQQCERIRLAPLLL